MADLNDITDWSQLQEMLATEEYGLGIRFVAPELIMAALTANDKVSQFGIRRVRADLI
jgi:hypothetical protein